MSSVSGRIPRNDTFTNVQDIWVRKRAQLWTTAYVFPSRMNSTAIAWLYSGFYDRLICCQSKRMLSGDTVGCVVVRIQHEQVCFTSCDCFVKLNLICFEDFASLAAYQSQLFYCLISSFIIRFIFITCCHECAPKEKKSCPTITSIVYREEN